MDAFGFQWIYMLCTMLTDACIISEKILDNKVAKFCATVYMQDTLRESTCNIIILTCNIYKGMQNDYGEMRLI